MHSYFLMEPDFMSGEDPAPNWEREFKTKSWLARKRITQVDDSHAVEVARLTNPNEPVPAPTID